MAQWPAIRRIRFQPQEALQRGIIWGFVGLIFGALFVPLWEFARQWAGPYVGLVLATTASGAVGGLFYGSMRLAFLIAIFTNIAVFGFLVSAPWPISPWVTMALGAGIGLLIGAVYGATAKDSKVFRADAKTLTGLAAGLAASVIAMTVTVLDVPLSIAHLVGVLAPATGLFYVLLLPPMVERFSNLLPPVGDGAVVGAAVGGFVGLGMWVVGGTVLDGLAGPWVESSHTIAQLWPEAVGFAMAGAFLLGFLRDLFNLHWVDI
jgi:hypothetical protein